LFFTISNGKITDRSRISHACINIHHIHHDVWC
jgi:hypothetical protein